MLMRFDPFTGFDHALFERMAPTGRRTMPMDAYRTGDVFRVDFDLPGVDPATIELTVEKNVLTVRAERHWEAPEGIEAVVWERPQGTYARDLFLGETLDAEHITAAYDNGVLSLTIPVAEQAKSRKIEVRATPKVVTARPAA